MSIDSDLREYLQSRAEAVSVGRSRALDVAIAIGTRRRKWRRFTTASMATLVLGVVSFVVVSNGSRSDGEKVATRPQAEEPRLEATAEPALEEAANDDVTEPRTLSPTAGRETTTAPIFGRVDPVAVWTGTEILLWGGIPSNDPTSFEFGPAGGAAYDPATDQWRAVWLEEPGWFDTVSTWTGNEILLWGGRGQCRGFDGETLACEPYQPAVHTMAGGAGFDTVASFVPAPIENRTSAQGLWTGERLIIWGGERVSDQTNESDGAVYDPSADAWERLPANPFGARGAALAAFHEDALFIGDSARDGGVVWSRYSFSEQEWVLISNPPVEYGSGASAVRVGSKLVVLGSLGGAILDMETMSWSATAFPAEPPDGTNPVVIGNRAVFVAPALGALTLYDVEQDTWSRWVPDNGQLIGARTLALAGESGVLVWNGSTGAGLLVDIDELTNTPTSD